MTVATSTLVKRVRDIIGEYQEWFEAVAEWYDCASWTKKVFTNYLSARNRPAGRARLTVNDAALDDSYRDRNASQATPT
jgi:hypothetical protein